MRGFSAAQLTLLRQIEEEKGINCQTTTKKSGTIVFILKGF